MASFEDLTGRRFGRLTVISRVEDYVLSNGGRRPQWLCECDCGVRKNVLASNLKRKTTSCGCYQRELLSSKRTSHGGWANKEKLYEVWHGIRKRCNCPTSHNYARYGGRGIRICSEWDDYSAFRSWALENGYAEGLSIDRIDVNGNYEPQNCRWATNKEQQNNKRNSIRITYNGETHTLKEWSEIQNINYQTLYQRYKLGWSAERMLTKQK